MNEAWWRLASRTGLAALAASAVDAFPAGWIIGPGWKPLQTGLAVVLFLCLLGKALIDTFYYDRR